MPTWLQSAPTGPESGTAVIAIITNLTNWLFIGFILLAVVMLVFASLQFLTSGGDPNNLAKARSKLLWAVIGIAAALVAKGIPVVVKLILGV